MVLGYIISEIKYSDLKEDIVKIVKSENECINDLPKLIVGLERAKEYAKKHNIEFDILNHVYSDGNMWTFKKTEKKDFYENDILEFKENIKNNFSKNVHYYYINIYNIKYNKFKILYNIIINNKFNRNINYILIDNNMLYYPLENNNVIGLSFNIIKYINIDKNKIIDKIKSNKTNYIYYSTNKKMWDLKKWFSGVEFVIPSILMKKELI